MPCLGGVAPSAGHFDDAATTTRAPSRSAFRIERERDVIRLTGDLRLAHAAPLWRQLCAATRDVSGAIAFDLSQADAIDGSTISLLMDLRAELVARGVHAEITAAPEAFRPLLRIYTAHPPPPRDGRSARRHPIEHLRDLARGARAEITNALDFLGNMGVALAAIVRDPRLGYWKSVPSHAEHAGADALPIVLLINALVGFAMAFQSAKQLQLYGANLYVADLVGISMTRELAPLMTAIVICGRSGAGYAAEIGTMKINEEIDALQTLGLRPYNWLVVPRGVAMLFVLPVLTVMADFVGVFGGMIVAVTDLDITPVGYLIETQLSVRPWDVATGLIKSVVFSVAIVGIACQQGFATSGGAESVGRRTTSTVVTSLFVLVFLDSVLTVIFRIFHV
ncbi:MAG: ABC-type transport system involved in resistance to organic solvent, permease component [Labilithrix sp.]|nr:ABC-type transport system involved in resistance to organic solvent, permease component [Labilithrix sp.]